MTVSKSDETCIVIGAGISGLAAAIRISNLGKKVILLEANSVVGGKIAQKNMNGFRFDSGPSVLTKPEYIKELFELCNKDANDYIQFEKPDRLFRSYFPDGTYIDSFSDSEKFRQELERKAQGSSKRVFDVLKDAKRIYKLTHEVFLERSLHKFKNYLNWPTIRGIFNFRGVHAFESMHRYNSRKLKNDKLIRLFNRYASYNGSNPYEAPATLNVISHFEITDGAFVPKGGMYKLIEALEKLALECGVEIHTNSPVQEIQVENRKVIGVRLKDKVITGSIVVCNTDIHFAYKILLPNLPRPHFILNQPASSSAIVFLWGMKESVPSIGLHTTIFGANDQEEYRAIFKGKTICVDPSIYIYNSSSHFLEDAPTGKANWFVMVTAPFDAGQDWESLISLTRKRVIKKLSKNFNVEIKKLIEFEEVVSPKSIEAHTGSLNGSIYGNSSNGIFSAFLRHPNFSKSTEGLYFCGGSVHPGSGIPLCLLSAKIVVDLIQKK